MGKRIQRRMPEAQHFYSEHFYSEKAALKDSNPNCLTSYHTSFSNLLLGSAALLQDVAEGAVVVRHVVVLDQEGRDQVGVGVWRIHEHPREEKVDPALYFEALVEAHDQPAVLPVVVRERLELVHAAHGADVLDARDAGAQAPGRSVPQALREAQV